MSLVYTDFDPDQEGLREALCTLGNGFVATRGAAPEAEADQVHYPGTYLAGGYNRLVTRLAGRDIENEDLVNFPNWLPLAFRAADGDWFNALAVEILAYRQELDLKRGMLSRTVRFRDRQGRETTLDSERLVHMGHRHLAAASLTVTAHNWSGSATVRGALDGRVVNGGVERYRGLNASHLKTLAAGQNGDAGVYLIVETAESRIRMAQAARLQARIDGRTLPAARRTVREADYIGEELAVDLDQGRPVRFEKVVAIFTSRDPDSTDCGRDATEAVAAAGTMERLATSHVAAWERLWRRADVRFTDGSDRETMLLRLHIFHLLQTFSPNSVDLDVGVPARGLHGEAYRGHIFWDELFILPFFNFRFPQLARAILMYRYHRLPAARAAAEAAGLSGAAYPWQSAAGGSEESQEVHLNPRSGHWIADHSHLQRHINAAIVFNIWTYVATTADFEFLSAYGAEMILECARLFAGLARPEPDGERFRIAGVMGPDEYHDGDADAEAPGLTNNAYTNLMAAWVLWRALDVLDLLADDRRAELTERLALTDDEIARWDTISRRLHVGFFDDWIIAQFDGYERLAELDWPAYRDKYGDIQRLDRILEAEGDTPNRYKLSKQADVLMLFYLFSAEQLCGLFQRLGYDFPPDAIPRNVDYYLKRTAHGSTLSRVVHSWVLARSDRARSWSLFRQSLESDVADIQDGTTKEGVHLGAMAATVDIIQRCYAGVDVAEGALWLNPCLPQELGGLDFSLWYRGNRLDVSVSEDRASVSVEEGSGAPVEIIFKGAPYRLYPGRPLEFTLDGSMGGHARPAVG